MTKGSRNALNNTRKTLDEIIDSTDHNTIPPQKPNRGDIVGDFSIFTNPATGGTYKYVVKTPPTDLNGNPVKELAKNSWIFYPHDADVDFDYFDPADGNFWVDDRDAYICYVYNNGELDDRQRGWIALTDKKKGFDNFVIQVAPSPKGLTFIDPNSTSDNIVDLLPGVILKQGYIYYNTTHNDLYVWSGETDGYGNVTGDDEGEWIQISRRSLEPSEDDMKQKSYYEMLLDRVSALEQKLATLPT